MSLAPCLALAMFMSAATESEPSVGSDPSVTTRRRPTWYVGINPLAALTNVGPLQFRMYWPIVTGLEYGLALAGGRFWRSHALEGRFSVGTPQSFDISTLWQLHAAYNFFVLDHVGITRRGLYLGGQVRFWHLRYRTVGVDYFNFAPGVHIGYWVEAGPVFLDFRLSQLIAAFTGTSLEHGRPAASWMLSPATNVSPVMPLFSITVGWWH